MDAVVDIGRFGIHRRRPHHAAMQHARNAHILRVDEFTREFRRQVDTFHLRADNLVILITLGGNFRGDLHVPAGSRGRDLHVEVLAAHQFPVGDFLCRIARDTYHAVANSKPFYRRSQPCRGEFQKLLPACRRGLAQLRSGPLECPAARGYGLVHRSVGVPRIHINALKWHIEFFRHHLRQRGLYAGAQLHLAGEDRNFSVLRDGQPGIKLCGIQIAAALCTAPCPAAWANARDAGPQKLKPTTSAPVPFRSCLREIDFVSIFALLKSGSALPGPYQRFSQAEIFSRAAR